MNPKLEEILEEAADRAGVALVRFWEQPGPEDTTVERHGVVCIGRHLFYWQTFSNGTGWDIYSACPHMNTAKVTGWLKETLEQDQ